MKQAKKQMRNLNRSFRRELYKILIAFFSSAFLAFGLYNVHAFSEITEGGVTGSQDSQNRVLELIRKMTEDGMSENISRIAKDPDFLEEMLGKY